MNVKADANNIKRIIENINTFNSTPGQGTTRVLFTEPELKSREYIKTEMEAVGLAVTEDAVGNIFGTLKGMDESLAPVWTGSHIDTVLNAGMFDGMAGIVCGIEALRIMQQSGITPKRSISVNVYTSEEPTRFGLSCLGSRTMAGVLKSEDMKQLVDQDGKNLYAVLKELGYPVDRLDTVVKRKGDVHAALELHVEQNRHLDDAQIPIGIVRGICAPTNYEVTIRGCQSHAGGTSMADRHDAFAACCEFETCLEKLARESNGEYVTATVGRVNVVPGAVNVISGYVTFSVDIRSIDMESKEKLMEQLEAERVRIEQERGVSIEMKLENHDVPLRCDSNILEMIRQSCEENGFEYKELISGPYHDSLFIGRFAPTAMLFVPSKDGISHSVEEWTNFEDLAIGTDVLASVLLKLANQ